MTDLRKLAESLGDLRDLRDGGYIDHPEDEAAVLASFTRILTEAKGGA